MTRREEIIAALDLLADVRFQYDAWVRRTPSADAPNFNDLIADLYDTGDVRRVLGQSLAESGLTRKQHHALEAAVTALDALLESHPSEESDEVMLQDPRWPQIRIAAGRAAKALRETD
ncbi:MAG: SCO4402 family protein [Vulcanimicrobiaceae bacterium]